MVPQSLRQHYPYLRTLKHSNRRKNILRNSTYKQLKVICNICHNITTGGLPVSRAYKTKLKRHKRVIRRLALKSIPLKEKRRLMINQTGGFWPLLLGTLVPSVISAISALR